MNCPNCKSEINQGQKFCTNCGYKIENIEEENNNLANGDSKTEETSKDIIFKNKNILIALAVLIIFVAVGISAFFIFRENTADVSTYKSITAVEKLDNMQTKTALDLMIQQDNDLTEYINKHKKANIDKLFEVFYLNISKLVHKINVDDLNINLVDNNGYATYELTPKTEIISFEVNDWTGVWINSEYLKNKYSKNLSTKWQEYLNLSANSVTNESTPLSMLNIEEKTITDEINSWQRFLDKYPDFVMNEDIKAILKDLNESTKKEEETELEEQEQNENCDKINYNGYTRDNCITESMYSDEEREKAYKFAYKINTVFENEDIETLSDMVIYPFTLNHKIKLNNKQEFLNVDKKLIFNDEIKQATRKKNVFDNYQGFMLGNGEIWFSLENNGDFSITSISVLE